METTRPASRNLLLAFLLLLCVAGLVIAGLLGQMSNTVESVCESTGCATVLGSRYSHIGRWPIAWVGMAFYAVMILIWGASAGCRSGFFRRTILQIGLALSALAILVSCFLLIVQIFLIHAICPLCTASAAICLAIGCILFYLSRRADWAPQPMAAIAAVLLAGMGLWLLTRSPGRSIVARVGDTVITRHQMESELGPAGSMAEWEQYRAEKDWLDQKITDILVKREAAARHITPAELVQTEVNEPVDKRVDAFMDANAQKLKPEDRDIVRQEMHTRFKADRADEFVMGLMRKYDAVEYLPAPLIDEKDLTALPGEHLGGDAKTAPIRLVIFSDFACEYCAQTAESIQHAFTKYGDRISLTFHYLPLDIHYRSADAATSAACAAEQNQFWKYHNALMTHNGQLGGIDFVQLAGQLGLDQNKFQECLASKTAAGVIAQSKKQANLLGIDSTPAVFLNGQRIGGALNESQLSDWIERTLKEKQ